MSRWSQPRGVTRDLVQQTPDRVLLRVDVLLLGHRRLDLRIDA